MKTIVLTCFFSTPLSLFYIPIIPPPFVSPRKPKAGGISAVGGTGSIYTFYGPDAPEFKQLSEDAMTRWR
jgi:hypothetical protein